MSILCPQCGSENKPDETCVDRFYATQLQEQTDPAYYAVHHLSVPCFYLQHNLYSRKGWLEVRDLLHKFVYEGWTPAMARQKIRLKMDNGKRDWSFTKGEKLPGVEHVNWKFSIMDVRTDTADHYCADVHHWAEMILADSDELVHKNSS